MSKEYIKRQLERRINHSNDEAAERRRGERRRVVSQAERNVLFSPTTGGDDE